MMAKKPTYNQKKFLRANQIKERFKKIGVKAFTKNDDATPQLEDHVERNDDK